MTHTLHFDDHNFRSQVLESDRPVLVDFWAPWCGPCRIVGPTIDQVSDSAAGNAKVGKLNIDDSPETAKEFGITAIPTVLVFRDGQVVERLVGVHPQATYQVALDQAAA